MCKKNSRISGRPCIRQNQFRLLCCFFFAIFMPVRQMTLRAWRTTSLGRLRWSPSTPSPPPSPYLRPVSWGSSGRLSPLTVTEVLRGLGITVCTVTGYVVGSAAFLPVCSIWFGTICSIFLPTLSLFQFKNKQINLLPSSKQSLNFYPQLS